MKIIFAIITIILIFNSCEYFETTTQGTVLVKNSTGRTFTVDIEDGNGNLIDERGLSTGSLTRYSGVITGDITSRIKYSGHEEWHTSSSKDLSPGDTIKFIWYPSDTK